ncbi:MAG: transcriptional regulator [Proteobacteria bacterium]|nr:transcriptional regulator [Pseudomonadota bacterium]
MLKPLRNETDYRAALDEAERLWDAPEDSPEADSLELLALLIEDYESRNYPIADPDPIDFLIHAIEARGMDAEDLEPFIGGRVDEVLNRVRPLSLDMIRNLTEGLHLPAEVLIRRYPLQDAA